MKAKRFVFIGGVPCLDFLNIASLGKPAVVETLRDFDDFLVWLSEARVIGARDRRRVSRRREREPEFRRALARALVLRRVLREPVEKILADRCVPPVVVTYINDLLAEMSGRWKLARTKTGFVQKSSGRDLIVPTSFSGRSRNRRAIFSTIVVGRG